MGRRLRRRRTASTASTRRLAPPAAASTTRWSTRPRRSSSGPATRLRLSADHTVVALAGATGSGKSSTFNALTGLELAAVGVRRPTTSWATACVWGARRAPTSCSSGSASRRGTRSCATRMLDEPAARTATLDGLVLLDLPDHDSTEVAHHLEVDRLVELADLLVWVLDPQKYADAAIHDRYLAPLATHQRRDAGRAQPHRHGARGPPRRRWSTTYAGCSTPTASAACPVIATSAPAHGDGIAELQRAIAERVAAKKVDPGPARGRRRAAAAERLRRGQRRRPGRATLADGRAIATLDDAFADAAGVPTVVDAVEQSTRLRAGRATGWPVTAWLSRLKPDPLKRLHLDLGAERQGAHRPRAHLGARRPTQVQRARVDTAVRALADDVSAPGWRRPWADAVRRASVSRLPDLGDRLDAAVAATDLGVGRTPLWWRLVRVLQWLLMLAALVGGLWLLGLAVLGYLQIPQPADPRRRPASRCRRCCCSAGWPRRPARRWSAGAWSACPRAAGRGRPTGGCARRSRGHRASWSSSRSRPSSRPTGPRATGLAAALR